MTDFEFAMKHRKAFDVFCSARKISANPYDTKATGSFRKAVEKQLLSIRKSQPKRPKKVNLIGEIKPLVESPAVTHYDVSPSAYDISDKSIRRNLKRGYLQVDSNGFAL